MTKAYVLGGTMADPTTLKLDEPLPMTASKLRVTIEPLQALETRPLMEVMEEIWAAQKARGHVPPTREEVDAFIDEGRDDRDELP